MATQERVLQLPDADAYTFPIYNCAGQSARNKNAGCPGNWNALAPGYVETVRKCAQCGRNVYMAKYEDQVRIYDDLKYTFVIDITAIERERQQKTKLPLQFSSLTHIDRRKKQPPGALDDPYEELQQFHRRRQDAA